jgi:hypothetical protein
MRGPMNMIDVRGPVLFLACFTAGSGCDASTSRLQDREMNAVGAARPVSIEDVEEASIGEPAFTIDGYQVPLVRVGSMVPSASGDLAVLQASISTILIVDTTGAISEQFGREGEGPGEFTQINRAGWIADTLWVSDSRLRRISFYTVGQDVLRDVPFYDAIAAGHDPGSVHRYPRTFLFPWAVYGDGSKLMYAIETDAEAHGDSIAALLSVDGADTIASVVMRIPGSPDSMDISYSNAATGVKGSVPVPYSPKPMIAISPDGAWIASAVLRDHATFDLVLLDRFGARAWSRTFRHSPRMISVSAVDSAIKTAVGGLGVQLAGERDYVARQLGERIPSQYPAASHLFLGTDGSVWVGLWPSVRREWLRVGSDGDPMYVVGLQPDIQLMAASATFVWGIRRDSLDVESIVGFRLEARE